MEKFISIKYKASQHNVKQMLKIVSLNWMNVQMEREGLIKGYTAFVDHEKLGYQLTALIEITVSKGRLLEIEKEIAGMPNVCSVYDVTGLADAFIIAKFKSREDLSAFAKRL